MYIVVSKIQDSFDILDTSDNSVQTVSKDELAVLFRSGIKVYGATDLALKYNFDVHVILRLYNVEGAKDYDGYCLYEASQYEDTFYQILDIQNERDALIDPIIYSKVLEALRFLNPKPEIKITTNYTYEIYSVEDKNDIDVIDYRDNERYAVDFFFILSKYIEGEAIKGVDEITFEYIRIGETYYWASNVLAKFNINYRCKQVFNTGYTLVDNVSSNYDNLDSTFAGDNFVVLQDVFIPLYNSKNCVRRLPGNAILPWFSRYDTAIKFEKHKLYFQNGEIIDNADTLAYMYNVIDFANDEVKQQVDSYLTIVQTKGQMLSKDYDFYTKKKMSRDFTTQSLANNMISFTWTYSPYFYQQNTFENAKFKDGCLSIQNNFVFRKKPFSMLFLSRIPRVGQSAFSFDSMMVEKATGSSIASSCMDSLKYLEYIESAVNNGIAYHNDVIVPLCISGVFVSDDSYDVKVICLVRPYTEDYPNPSFKSETYGISAIEIPLIFCGGKWIEYDDCYSYSTMLQTLYIQKSLVQRLFGSYDYSDYLNIFRGVHLKANGKIQQVEERTMKSILKRVLTET